MTRNLAKPGLADMAYDLIAHLTRARVIDHIRFRDGNR
jgi:hypothetical protein